MTPKCGIFFSLFESLKKVAQISVAMRLTLLLEATDTIYRAFLLNRTSELIGIY
jgi:hypothetical protein